MRWDLLESIKLCGRVDLARLMGALAMGDPEQCKGRLRWLLDLGEAQLALTRDDIRQLAFLVNRYRTQTRCADEPCTVAIISDGDVNFGICRMIQGYAEAGNVDIFVTRSREEAELHLNGDAALQV